MLTKQKSQTKSRLRTPLKSIKIQQSPSNSKFKVVQSPSKNKMDQSSIKRKLTFKAQSKQKNTNSGNKNKIKERISILLMVQDIYENLNFTQYEAFPLTSIQAAKKNIQKLYVYLKAQPICPKHQELLNLYCENDKEVLCVSCIYKGNLDHKTHKIRTVEAVQKILDYQSIKIQQKSKSLENQLYQIKQEMGDIQNQVSDNYRRISSNTISLINDAIGQLQKLKVLLERDLGLSYSRTTAILNRYSQCIERMTQVVHTNLLKCKNYDKLSKYLLLKQLNKECSILEDIVWKFNDNKLMMQNWKKCSREFERIIIKKKGQNKFSKQDVYVVTQF